VARPKSIRANPISGQLLDAIREWETARLSGAFSVDQRERLKNPKNEFHLERTGESEWNLYQYRVEGKFTYIQKERQPGEPLYDTWNFELVSFDQPLQFKLDVNGTAGSVRNIKILLDNYYEIQIQQELGFGETLICDGSTVLRVYDQKGKLKNKIELPSVIPVMKTGSHQFRFSCEFSSEPAPAVAFEVKSMGKAERITSSR